jgi:hypothetical protein
MSRLKFAQTKVPATNVATGRDKHGDAVEITSGDAPAGATA